MKRVTAMLRVCLMDLFLLAIIILGSVFGLTAFKVVTVVVVNALMLYAVVYVLVGHSIAIKETDRYLLYVVASDVVFLGFLAYAGWTGVIVSYCIGMIAVYCGMLRFKHENQFNIY